MRQSRWIQAWQRRRFRGSRICDDDENGHDNRKHSRYHDSARLPNRRLFTATIVRRVRRAGGYNCYANTDYICEAEIKETVWYIVAYAQ